MSDVCYTIDSALAEYFIDRAGLIQDEDGSLLKFGGTAKDFADVCEPWGSGLFLPIFPGENLWPKEVRALFYFLGLIYCFMGVGIIADVFLAAIEVITSKTKKIEVVSVDKKGVEQRIEIDVQVWNGTIANLSLMALGSSAPEILLSLIELSGNEYFSGELGPSTIVGSAAFNLLCICAVCVYAIPDGEVRTIKDIKVFGVTAFFSVWAYLWMLIILLVISPDRIEIWEAVVTLLFFPLLLFLAYAADRNWFRYRVATEEHIIGVEYGGMKLHFRPQEAVQYVREVAVAAAAEGQNLTDEDIANMAVYEAMAHQKKSRAVYRINAMKQLTGGGQSVPPPPKDRRKSLVLSRIESRRASFSSPQEADEDTLQELKSMAAALRKTGDTEIGFLCPAISVLECEPQAVLHVYRKGNDAEDVVVSFETMDGTANAGSDYHYAAGVLHFRSGENLKTVAVDIIDDDEYEDDETFFVKLMLPSDSTAKLVTGVACVTIINDDDPGFASFDKASYTTKETDRKVRLTVQRINGSSGQVSVGYRTEDVSAVAGQDYIAKTGTLVFENGESSKIIEIEVMEDFQYEKDETFIVELLEPTGGLQLGETSKCVVTIVGDEDFRLKVDNITALMNLNSEKFKVSTSSYAQQFKEAMTVCGDPDMFDEASLGDWIMHFVTFLWKVLFALTPPSELQGGWVCFGVALMFIGLLTGIISDLASLLGCCIGLRDDVNAITLVALGTSLPDTFASMAAAKAEDTADNSIGNVTGSNSVNVFLGLGLPWTIAAFYWAAVGRTDEWTVRYGHDFDEVGFIVYASNLGYSVTVFSCCAIVAISTLLIRRKLFGGELGGPRGPKIFTSVLLLSLWFGYVLLSALNSYGHIPSF
eukprot:Rmarinus@m.9672